MYQQTRLFISEMKSCIQKLFDDNKDIQEKLQWLLTCMWNLQLGIVPISAVTMAWMPRLASEPLRMPQEKTTYLGASSRYCDEFEICLRKRNELSWRT